MWGQGFGLLADKANPDHRLHHHHDFRRGDVWTEEDERYLVWLRRTAWLKNFDHYMHTAIPVAFGIYVGIMFLSLRLGAYDTDGREAASAHRRVAARW